MHLCEPKQCPGVKPEYPLSEVPPPTFLFVGEMWEVEPLSEVLPPTFLFVSLHLFVFLGKKSLKNKSKSSIV